MTVELDKLRHETAMKIIALSDRSEVSISAIERILRDHDATVQAWQDAANWPNNSDKLDEFAQWLGCGRTIEVNQRGNYVIPSNVPKWTGCYHLILDDGFEYIGEGFSLNRRINEYLDRASSAGDRAMRDRIKAAGGMKIFVSVQTNTKQLFSSYKEHETAFPGAKAARRLFEAKFEAEARELGAYTLNSSGERRQ